MPIQFKKIESNAKSIEGLAKLLALGSPPTDFINGGITKSELTKALKNSGNGTSIIAIDALDTEKYMVSMRYANEWARLLKTGETQTIEVPEVLEAADAIISGKKQPIDILNEAGKEHFGTRGRETVLGFVLGEIVSACKQLKWNGKKSCPDSSKNCGKTGYIYYLLSAPTPKNGAKRSGIGLRLAYESTKNFFNTSGINTVNAHSYGIASRELFKKLGYKHMATVKGFYPDINPDLKDAYLMCITKEKFKEMKKEYENIGLCQTG